MLSTLLHSALLFNNYYVSVMLLIMQWLLCDLLNIMWFSFASAQHLYPASSQLQVQLAHLILVKCEKTFITKCV